MNDTSQQFDPGSVPVIAACGPDDPDRMQQGAGPEATVLMVRQNWIAASENTAGRPGLPSGGANQVISWSSQISSDPRLRSEAV